MRRGAGAAFILFLVAGCDSAPREATAPIKIVNPYHDQLKALPADLQRLGLMRAIRDNGKRCRRVEEVGYQEDYGQMAMWVARCPDGRNWGIFIAPNGDTQVRDCVEMRELRLPQCRPTSETTGAAERTKS